MVKRTKDSETKREKQQPREQQQEGPKVSGTGATTTTPLWHKASEDQNSVSNKQ
jgi:hypothetical protein